jgi:ABC-2 type transport system permease protein
VRSAPPEGPPGASAEHRRTEAVALTAPTGHDAPQSGRVPTPLLPGAVPTTVWRQFPSRVAAFCIVELQRLRHDRTELATRAVQPILWLLIYGETFTRLHAIPTGRVPYLAFLTPGIVAQSGLFIAIFYGIQIIWERDAGILTKLLVTPTPRSALILGKSFAAGIRAASQVVVVLGLAAVLGVALTHNVAAILGSFVVVMLGAAFFSCLSMTVAGVVLKRDRLMGIGQMITMPLFFASNALYPVKVMPGWLQALSRVNPLSYEVDALRSLLIGSSGDLALDFGVMIAAVVVAVTAASSLVGRLAR